MAVPTIDDTGATAYFAASNHPRSAQWTGFGSSPRTAAVANAKRTLSRALGVDLADANLLPSDGADLTAFPRFDFAVFEQALFDLTNGVIADGSQATPKFIAGRTEPNTARERQTGRICPEALAWICRGRVILSRG